MEVDRITGRPIGETKKAEQATQDQRVLAEGEAVEGALRTKTGQKLRDAIEAILLQRIGTFLKSDEQCKALLALLDELGFKIDMAKGVTVKLMKEKLKI